MEGLLQSFKFKEWSDQKELILLVGYQAKLRGTEENWKSTQVLWWKGQSYYRESEDYQLLLDYAYEALYTNKGFRDDLAMTGYATLGHAIGRSDIKETILTEKEFCDRLTQLRENKKLIDPIPGEKGVNDYIDALIERKIKKSLRDS